MITSRNSLLHTFVPPFGLSHALADNFDETTRGFKRHHPSLQAPAWPLQSPLRLLSADAREDFLSVAAFELRVAWSEARGGSARQAPAKSVLCLGRRTRRGESTSGQRDLAREGHDCSRSHCVASSNRVDEGPRQRRQGEPGVRLDGCAPILAAQIMKIETKNCPLPGQGSTRRCVFS